MTEAADRALARLRAPDGEALRQLATLVVREATATPLAELAPPRWVASQIATALEAATHGDLLKNWVDGRLDAARERWSDEEHPPRHWMPPEIDEPLRKVIGRPWTPDPELTARILDHDAVRNLLSDILEDAVRRFAKKVRNLDNVAGGLGGRAVRRGRGLLGNLAGDLVGAVAEEVETALDKRVKDYVGSATTRAVKSIVRRLSDPADAETYAQFRVAILDVLLDTPLKDLARELDKTRPEEMIDVVIEAIRRTIADEHFVDETTSRVEALLAEAGDGTLATWLDDVGLTDVWTETTTELVTSRLQAVVVTDDFETWWSALFA